MKFKVGRFSAYKPDNFKAKLVYAIERYSEFLNYTFPQMKPEEWCSTIGKNEYSINNLSFEHIYRCYHHSFKVVHMKTSVCQLVDLTLFLFSEIADIEMLEAHKNYLGFPPITRLIFPEKTTYLKVASCIYKEGSMSFGFVKDILSRKPSRKGPWDDYTKHHLTYMGGVYWSVLTTISILGILQAEQHPSNKKEYYITYPRGIKDYYLSDLVDYKTLQENIEQLREV